MLAPIVDRGQQGPQHHIGRVNLEGQQWILAKLPSRLEGVAVPRRG